MKCDGCGKLYEDLPEFALPGVIAGGESGHNRRFRVTIYGPLQRGSRVDRVDLCRDCTCKTLATAALQKDEALCEKLLEPEATEDTEPSDGK